MKKFYFLVSLIVLSIVVNAQSVIHAKGVTFNIPGATSTYITCTNDSNDFGGYYLSGSNYHGFYFDAQANDTFYVNYPGAVNTWVYGINNAKEMVGAYNTTGAIADNKGFKFTEATLTYLDVTSSWLASQTIVIARGINDGGCVVGDYKESTSHVGFSMCGGNNTPVNYNYNPTYLYGLNNAGRAVGFYMDVNNASLHYGIIREAGGAWNLLNFPGATKTHLCGINDSNVIVGTFNTTSSFIYKNGVFKEIKKTNITDFQLQDINNYGLAVGYYKNAAGNYCGFYMPLCDIGFRPNPNGWSFDNSDANIWPQTWWSQFDYSHDPYLGGVYIFPKIPYNNGTMGLIPSKWFPDWPLFVKTFGENNCYDKFLGILFLKTISYNKWHSTLSIWGGSCFGFSTSANLVWDSLALFKTKFPNVGPWTASNKLYELPANKDNSLCINELMIKQYQKGYLRHCKKDADLTPLVTLKKLKKMLLDNEKDEGGLCLRNQNGGGGHIVNPFKIVIDTVNPNLEYIYIYDNNYPGDSTRFIKINKLLDAWYYCLSVNAGVPSDEWGGDDAHKGLFVDWPSSLFYPQPLVDSVKKADFGNSEKNADFEIFNSTNSNIIINNQTNGTIGFLNNNVIDNLPGASPTYTNVGNQIPIGYLLPDDQYSVEMKDFSDSLARLSLFNDNSMYVYSRGYALISHKDKFTINANGIKFINTDNISKDIRVQSVADDMGAEKTFTLSKLPLHTNSDILFSIIANDKLKVVNEGIATKYNLELQLVSTSGVGTFKHDSIVLDANTTHIISMNWPNIQSADLQIFVDNGNNGVNDDTLFFINQGTPIIVTNPTQIQNSSVLQTDTLFIGNLGSGSMAWTATTDAPTWISFIGGNTGTNFGSVRYSTIANTGAERVGHVTITAANASNSPYIIEVRQAGVVAAPGNFTASDGTYSDGIHLSWDQASGATYYMVYRSTVAGDNGTAISGWITTLNYIDNTALNGNFYYYSVKAAQSASGLNATGFSTIDDGWRTCFTADFICSGTCLGQPTVFTNMSSVHTAAYFLWDIDNNGTIDYTGTNCSHIYATAGTKTVKLTVTDSSLCTNTFQKTITILPFPSLNLLSDTTLCANQSVTLHAGSGFSSYLWSTGATSSSATIDSTGYGLGMAPVYVSVTNANGCSAKDTTVITWNICTEISTQQLKDFAVNIYPNPTNSLLNVSIEGNISEMTVELFNFNGQNIYNQKISDIYGHYNFTIDTKQFKAGIYFLRCISENRVEVKKVIVY